MLGWRTVVALFHNRLCYKSTSSAKSLVDFVYQDNGRYIFVFEIRCTFQMVTAYQRKHPRKNRSNACTWGRGVGLRYSWRFCVSHGRLEQGPPSA